MRSAVTAPMPDDAPVIRTLRSRTASSSDLPITASTRFSPYNGRLRPAALGRLSTLETAPTGLPTRLSAVFAGFILLVPLLAAHGGSRPPCSSSRQALRRCVFQYSHRTGA